MPHRNRCACHTTNNNIVQVSPRADMTFRKFENGALISSAGGQRSRLYSASIAHHRRENEYQRMNQLAGATASGQKAFAVSPHPHRTLSLSISPAYNDLGSVATAVRHPSSFPARRTRCRWKIASNKTVAHQPHQSQSIHSALPAQINIIQHTPTDTTQRMDKQQPVESNVCRRKLMPDIQ